MRPSPSTVKRWLYKRGGLSWGHNLVVFYYLSAIEIWLDKMVWWELSYKRETTVVYSEPFWLFVFAKFLFTMYICILVIVATYL